MVINLLGVGVVFDVGKNGLHELVAEFVLFNLKCSVTIFYMVSVLLDAVCCGASRQNLIGLCTGLSIVIILHLCNFCQICFFICISF